VKKKRRKAGEKRGFKLLGYSVIQRRSFGMPWHTALV
jgi:hypothetical protein